ncbi:MAG: surface antigen [Halioglobus sp.]|jgi:surface antigen
MPRHYALTTVFVVSLAVASEAFATWNWMRDATLAQFNDADWSVLKATARETLDSADDGKQVNWANEDTGTKGAMKAIMTFQYEGQNCRRMAFLNINKNGERGVSNYNLCRQPDGSWAFVADSVVTDHGN